MTIHTALVAEQSPTLRSLVSGFMEEAQTGTVIWEDVDPGTFALFAQFVYTGDYFPSPCIITEKPQASSDDKDPGIAKALLLDEHIEETGVNDVDLVFPEFGSSKKKKSKQAEAVVGRTEFHDLVYSPLVSFNSAERCKPRPNKSAVEDFSPVFLGHALID